MMFESSDKNVDVVLSPVSDGDLESLVAIRIEAMRESLERLGRFDPDRARERFLDGFEADATSWINVSGHRVGFVVLKDIQGSLLLDHLYVRPEAQGKGIGAEVLAMMFKEADETGRPIKVGALKESASNRFYLRHGFTLTGSGEFDHYYLRVGQGKPRTGE